MIPRLVSLVAALALVIGVATACTPQPTPTPSPTGFASEEEAFAAAEETYRAYMAAVNSRRENPQSKRDPIKFLIGEALEADIDTERQFDAEGLRIVGDTKLLSATPTNWTPSKVSLAACIDSSETRVLSETDGDVTPQDRRTSTPLAVELVLVGNELLIQSTTVDGTIKC